MAGLPKMNSPRSAVSVETAQAFVPLVRANSPPVYFPLPPIKSVSSVVQASEWASCQSFFVVQPPPPSLVLDHAALVRLSFECHRQKAMQTGDVPDDDEPVDDAPVDDALVHDAHSEALLHDTGMTLPTAGMIVSQSVRPRRRPAFRGRPDDRLSPMTVATHRAMNNKIITSPAIRTGKNGNEAIKYGQRFVLQTNHDGRLKAVDLNQYICQIGSHCDLQ
jgi:hypothetical protein